MEDIVEDSQSWRDKNLVFMEPHWATMGALLSDKRFTSSHKARNGAFLDLFVSSSAFLSARPSARRFVLYLALQC